jgi:Mn-dependent DtxR family transcriptional regulator
MGQFLFARHGIIEAFLRNIGAGEDVMTETELIEHSISAHTVERLRRFNAFAGAHPGLIAELERYSGHDD